MCCWVAAVVQLVSKPLLIEASNAYKMASCVYIRYGCTYVRTQQYSIGVPATYVRVCLKCFAVMIDYHLSMCVAEVYSIHIVFQWLMCVYRSSIMVPTVLCVW